MIEFKTGTDAEKERLKAHVDRILAAKRKGEAAEVEVYDECIAIERSDLWTITGMSWKQFLRDGVGVDVGRYVAYKACVDLVGHEALGKMGLAAGRELWRLIGTNAILAKTLGRAVSERVVGFRMERGYGPSVSYARAIVEDEARRAGVDVVRPPNGSKRALRKAIATLKQIAELGGEAGALARVCLRDIGHADARNAAAHAGV